MECSVAFVQPNGAASDSPVNLSTWNHPPAIRTTKKSDLFTRGGHLLRVLIKLKKKKSQMTKTKAR